MKNSQAFLKPPPSSSISSSSLIISSKREIEIFSYNFITLVTIAYLTFSHVCLCFKLRFFLSFLPLHHTPLLFSSQCLLESFFIQAICHDMETFSQIFTIFLSRMHFSRHVTWGEENVACERMMNDAIARF